MVSSAGLCVSWFSCQLMRSMNDSPCHCQPNLQLDAMILQLIVTPWGEWMDGKHEPWSPRIRSQFRPSRIGKYWEILRSCFLALQIHCKSVVLPFWGLEQEIQGPTARTPSTHGAPSQKMGATDWLFLDFTRKIMLIWLVVWNMFYFSILGIIIPIDFHIFQRGLNHQWSSIHCRICPSHSISLAQTFKDIKIYQDVVAEKENCVQWSANIAMWKAIMTKSALLRKKILSVIPKVLRGRARVEKQLLNPCWSLLVDD